MTVLFAENEDLLAGSECLFLPIRRSVYFGKRQGLSWGWDEAFRGEFMQLVTTRAFQSMLAGMRRIIGPEYNMAQLRFNVSCVEYDAMTGKVVRPHSQREWEEAIAVEYYNNTCELDKSALRRVFIRKSHYLRSELVNGSTTATNACVPGHTTKDCRETAGCNDEHSQLRSLRPY